MNYSKGEYLPGSVLGKYRCRVQDGVKCNFECVYCPAVLDGYNATVRLTILGRVIWLIIARQHTMRIALPCRCSLYDAVEGTSSPVSDPIK